MGRLLTLGLALAWMATGVVRAAQAPLQSVLQQPQTKTQGPRGTVTGTVYCADANLPARVAQVSVIPIAGGSSGDGRPASTDLEGRFTISRVPEGKYF